MSSKKEEEKKKKMRNGKMKGGDWERVASSVEGILRIEEKKEREKKRKRRE